MNEAAATLKAAGIEVLQAVVPGKARLYRQFLPDDTKLPADIDKRYPAILADLRKSGALVPDLDAVFRAVRSGQPSLPVYFATDTHWTPAGAEVAAVELEADEGGAAPARPARAAAPLGAPTTRTNPASDLVRFLPADLRGKYPAETYQIREAQAAGGLLDTDDGADVVVVGNSFSQPKYGFVPLLAAQLDRPVGLAWRPNSHGPWFTLLEYLRSDGFRRRRPKALVWMHLELTCRTSRTAAAGGRMQCHRKPSWRRSSGRSADDQDAPPGRRAAGRDGACHRPGAGGAAAQAQVYDPQLPPGSAYLRFVNALGADLALRPDFLPAQALGTGPAQRVTPYAVVERAAGRDLTLEASSAGASGHAGLRLEPGSYVTLLLHRGPDGGIAATPVVDRADFDRAKARLGFYNAAPGCPAAALKLAANGATVFDQVAPGTVRTRSVNPVAALRAECEGAAASLAPESFEAGGSYSILLIRPEGTAPTALMVRAHGAVASVTRPARRSARRPGQRQAPGRRARPRRGGSARPRRGAGRRRAGKRRRAPPLARPAAGPGEFPAAAEQPRSGAAGAEPRRPGLSRECQALSAAAEVATQMNRPEAAVLLERLRRLAPNDPRTKQTESALRDPGANAAILDQARTLARTGRPAEAVQRYREAFHGEDPPPNRAVEFDSALAALSEAGAREAQEKLAVLARQMPAELPLQVAYAKLLTYREDTRAEGIEILQQLSSRPAAASAAREAWRQALLWQGPVAEAAEPIEAYLKVNPADKEMAEALRNARAATVQLNGMLHRTTGWNATGAGNFADAEREFRSAIAVNAQDAESVLGLAVVRRRQNRLPEMRQLLDEAIRLAPDRREDFIRALGTDGVQVFDTTGATAPASYTSHATLAWRALSRGDLDRADGFARRALRAGGDERVQGEVVLGQIAAQRGNFPAAEGRFRAALALRPKLPVGLAGLHEALQRQGRFAEVEALQQETGFRPPAGSSTARANAVRDQALREQDLTKRLACCGRLWQPTPAAPGSRSTSPGCCAPPAPRRKRARSSRRWQATGVPTAPTPPL